jgi:hypothetical protein
VNAILMAIVVTMVVLLDYCWPNVEDLLKQNNRAKKIKFTIIGGLLVFAWVQAAVQFYKDKQSDNDMNFLKEQLANANRSLTNSTDVVRGLTTGGNSTADFSFSQNIDDTNALDFELQTGEFPLRSLYVKITDETKRVNRDRSSSNSPPKDTVVFERYFGDFPAKAFQNTCSIRLDPAVTNYVRFDVSALNGSYWQILAIAKTNAYWLVRLRYRWSQVGGKLQIDPPSERGSIMVDD